MNFAMFRRLGALAAATVIFAVLMTEPLFAHCDTMNGPVVTAAKKALATGNVNLVLIWIQKKDEGEIRKAFERTRAVRNLNPEAKELADMYFFETLVRIHRTGEGEPYTGLKPTDAEIEPGIEAADQAVAKGSAEELASLVTGTVQKSIHTLFAGVTEKKNYKDTDIDGGREYIKAYVTFIHYAEALYRSAHMPAEGQSHGVEQEGAKAHDHR